jgi:glucokinase
MSADEGLVIGVDVGGTKVAAGLVGPEGTIMCQSRIPMVCDAAPESGLEAVKSAIESASAQARKAVGAHRLIHAIGICSPGPLDPKAGIVLNPPNLPCWRNFPLVSEVARIYRVKVKLDNDANAAALAEAKWGAGRGCPNLLYVTIGTGIGTAIVLNGHLYHGRTGAAGEGGHLSIDYRGPRCGCGKAGCIEALAAGPAIARRAQGKVEGGVRSSMVELAGGRIEEISSQIVGQAYSAGDAVATEVLHETVTLLAFWLGNLIDLLDPDVIIIGGGVASMLKPFFTEIRERLPGCCINSRCQEIPILPAQYGEDAGVAGGAALCWDASSSNGFSSENGSR